jgi:hypothetical protein
MKAKRCWYNWGRDSCAKSSCWMSYLITHVAWKCTHVDLTSSTHPMMVRLVRNVQFHCVVLLVLHIPVFANVCHNEPNLTALLRLLICQDLFNSTTIVSHCILQHGHDSKQGAIPSLLYNLRTCSMMPWSSITHVFGNSTIPQNSKRIKTYVLENNNYV